MYQTTSLNHRLRSHRWIFRTKLLRFSSSQLMKLMFWASFFCKTINSFHKTGHKTIQKTNHYILLTNVSIKRCTKTSFETGFIRGARGKSSSQTSTPQTAMRFIQVERIHFNVSILIKFLLFYYSIIVLKRY